MQSAFLLQRVLAPLAAASTVDYTLIAWHIYSRSQKIGT